MENVSKKRPEGIAKLVSHITVPCIRLDNEDGRQLW